MTSIHFGFKQNHLPTWAELMGEYSVYMPCLKKVISAHLLPRQQLLLRVHDWSAEKVPEDLAVLDAWPCCHVIEVFLVVAGQIRVVRHRKANTRQLFQVSSLRVSV